MVAVNYNLDIEKGSDFEISFIYADQNNNPINLSSNKCVKLSISGIDGNTEQVYSYFNESISENNTNNPLALLTSNASGIINIILSAAETNKYDFETGVYDLDVGRLGTPYNTRISAGLVNIINRNFPLILNNNQIDCTLIGSDSGGSDGGDDTIDPSFPTPTEIPSDTDFCLPYDCGPLNLFSVVYSGSGIAISDSSEPPVYSETTSSVTVSNTGIISNVELAINKLSHTSPSDLVFLLAPPSGEKILLSANSKITNFNNNFSFMFSNKASENTYLYNVLNGGLVNILDKTSIINYNNENLLSSFDHLFGYAVSGVWDLIIKDTDPLGSGVIDSWKLIITYEPDVALDIE